MDGSFFLLLSLLFLPPALSDLASDRAALFRLQTAVGGRTLRWNTSSATPCLWSGVTCDNTINRVVELRLPGNGLTGEIPANSIGNLTELRALSLRNNFLSGPIPPDLASCTLLEELHLVGNNFSGEIPSNFFTLTNLLRVNLAGNKFSGGLSSGFNSLTKLETLYLENNQFTGPLPDLNNLNNLRQFNVSFNGLTGSIPSSLSSYSSESFLGTSLCGGPLVSCPRDNSDNPRTDGPRVGSNGPKARNSGKLSGGAIAGIAVGSSLGLILILAVIFIALRSKHKSGEKLPPKNDKPMPPLSAPVKMPPENQTWDLPKPLDYGLVFFGEDVGVLSVRDLLKSSAQVMGKGTVGSTYKAYLDNGVEIIVKRLKTISLSEREFKGKIEGLGSLSHENLLPLGGYFSGRDEHLLIYDPLPKGSLYQLLHERKQQRLSWETRAKIAVGVARGINYLHSISSATTHGNIKASNILLTNDYDARVSEYGLAQLISSMAGSPNGYRAPEVTDTRKISQQADVYSFGVLLLELLTGKEPDNEEGIVLPNWVQSVVEDKWTIQVFDSELIKYELDLEESMVQLLHLAISCTALHPFKRPPMMQIMPRIEEICDSGN